MCVGAGGIEVFEIGKIVLSGGSTETPLKAYDPKVKNG